MARSRRATRNMRRAKHGPAGGQQDWRGEGQPRRSRIEARWCPAAYRSLWSPRQPLPQSSAETNMSAARGAVRAGITFDMHGNQILPHIIHSRKTAGVSAGSAAFSRAGDALAPPDRAVYRVLRYACARAGKAAGRPALVGEDDWWGQYAEACMWHDAARQYLSSGERFTRHTIPDVEIGDKVTG